MGEGVFRSWGLGRIRLYLLRSWMREQWRQRREQWRRRKGMG